MSAKRCETLYAEMRTRKLQPRKKPTETETATKTEPETKSLSSDSHRNMLSQVKTFLTWCIDRGWLRENPCADVKGIGKRRPRGKSLGKSGSKLCVREARAWFEMAVYRAYQNDDGAIAALVALLLRMRASEITTRKVSDLDADQADGDPLCKPCSKTPAGRRTLEVPEVLRPYLLACAGDEAPDASCSRRASRTERARGTGAIGSCTSCIGSASSPRSRRSRRTRCADCSLATITAERGLAGHLIATLGHEDARITMSAYAAPGSATAGVNRRGLVVLSGGAQNTKG